MAEEDEVEVEHLVRVRDVKEGVVLPLKWENPDVMAYVNLGAKYLDAGIFGALPSYGRCRRLCTQEGPVRWCTGPDVCVKKSGGL